MRVCASSGTKYLRYDGNVLASYPISIAAWAVPLNTTADEYALMLTNSATDSFLGVVFYGSSSPGGNTDRVNAVTNNAGVSTKYAQATSSYSANTLCHIVGVWDGSGNSTVYFNGGNSATVTGIVAITRNRVCVGGYQILSGTAGANVHIGEVAMWGAALTAADAASLYAGYSPVEIRPSSLAAYWPLGGHYGRYDLDRWKNKYDLTPSNSPTWADHPRVIYPQVVNPPIKATVVSSTKYWLFGGHSARIIGGGIGT